MTEENPIQSEEAPLPAVRIVVEDYDAENPDHYAQWVVSGKPNLGDNPPWQPYFEEDLADDGETYVRRPQKQPPEEAPVTDVEKYKEVFVGARQNATLLVDTIKASVQDALVKSGAYSASEATIQGVDFVFYHGNDIANYKEAGGHPSAASRLLAAFNSAESAALFPWVKSVESVFDGALTY